MEDFRGQLSQAMQDSVAQVESISDGILENLDLLSSSAAAFYSAHRDELVLFGVLRSNDVLGIQAALSLAQIDGRETTMINSGILGILGYNLVPERICTVLPAGPGNTCFYRRHVDILLERWSTVD